MFRAVLDVNVLVSAFLSPRGPPAAVVAAWRDGRFDLLVSPALLHELDDVVVRPHLAGRIDRLDLAASSSNIRRDAVLITDPPPERHAPSDPDDDYLVALALALTLAAGAHAIVTGDKALLALDLDRLQALTPRDFLAVLERIDSVSVP